MPVFVPNPLTQIRFIACGDTLLGRNGLFYMFTRSFDPSLWFAMFAVVCFLVPLNMQVLSYELKPTLKVFTSICQTLVEQSTPFTSKIIVNNPIKIMLGFTLLSALVLSNAYKNDNMYELMNPKKFQPFKTIEQLRDANYSVFTLPYAVSIPPFCNTNIDALLNCIKIGFKLKGKFSFPQDEKNFVVESKHLNFPTKYRYLKNFSSVWMKTLDKLIPKIIERYTAHGEPKIGRKRHSQHTIHFDNSQDEIALMEELEKCNNIGFISQDKNIRRWELLLRQRKVRKIFSGMDILIRKYTGYKIIGWVPAFILKRTNGLMSSGILDWWNDFVSIYLLKIRTISNRAVTYTETYMEYLKTKKKGTDDQMSCFFLMFYSVLILGNVATVVYILEIFCYYKTEISQFVIYITSNRSVWLGDFVHINLSFRSGFSNLRNRISFQNYII